MKMLSVPQADVCTGGRGHTPVQPGVSDHASGGKNGMKTNKQYEKTKQNKQEVQSDDPPTLQSGAGFKLPTHTQTKN